jgi:hypothetical protein
MDTPEEIRKLQQELFEAQVKAGLMPLPPPSTYEVTELAGKALFGGKQVSGAVGFGEIE